MRTLLVSRGEQRASQMPTAPEIEEISLGENSTPPAEKVYVAVGKDKSESLHALRWALQMDNIQAATLILLHIKVPVRYIPSPMGIIPVNQASKDKLKAYENDEQQQLNNCMKNYLYLCSRAKVKAEPRVVEKADVSKGIVEAVSELGITKLIMGTTSSGGAIKKMKLQGHGIADYVQKHANESCDMSIVCKGKLVMVKEGSPARNVQKSKSYMSTLSIWPRKPEMSTVKPSLEDFTQSVSSTPNCQGELDFTFPASSISTNTEAWQEVVNESGFELSTRDITTEDTSPDWEELERTTDVHEAYAGNNMESEACANSSSISTIEGSEEENVDTEALQLQLSEALQEAENAKREAKIEIEKRKKADVAAIKAIKRLKEYEDAFKEATKQKEDTRSLLHLTKQQCEEITKQRDQAVGELESTCETLRALETKVNETSRQRYETIRELEAAQQKLATLEEQSYRVLEERNAAVRQLHDYLMSRQGVETSTSSSSNLQFTEYSFEDMKAATCNFADCFKLGEGGYGTVYKGEIQETTVAIKILREDSRQGQQEFQHESDLLRDLHHPHLVRVAGACFERGCIVYEYMSNGSLADRLCCKNGTPPLPWHARIRIAAEVCSALQFLHTLKPKPLVHHDLKPANILLDENLISKISDFGLACLLPPDSHIETELKGTFSYTDPEYLLSGIYTCKSDVYSLGMVILQLLTGKPAFGLAKEVEKALKDGKLNQVLDPAAGEWPFVHATQLAYLALHCTETNRTKRPDLHPTVMKFLDQLRTTAIGASTANFGSPAVERQRQKSVQAVEEIQTPILFLCPIFKEVMHDPHVAEDGFTYELEAIKGWLECGHDKSPMTNLKLGHKKLIPNHSLRSAIRQWQEKPISCKSCIQCGRVYSRNN